MITLNLKIIEIPGNLGCIKEVAAVAASTALSDVNAVWCTRRQKTAN